MPNESGDLKLLANFRKLIDLVSADTDYKPSNADVPAQFATNMTGAQADSARSAAHRRHGRSA